MLLNIAYIDDEIGMCQMFEDNYASVAGVDLHTFTDPEQAIGWINQNRPDLIFVDFRLPNTNGIELAQLIQVPTEVVLISGDLKIKLPPPFTKAFYKPFDFREMDQFIRERVEIKKKKNLV